MAEIFFEELFPELGCPVPQPAQKVAPEWFMKMNKWYGHDPNLDRNEGKMGSIRQCPAVHDAIFAGYTLFFPSDLYLDASGDDVKYRLPEGWLEGSRVPNSGFDYVVQHDPGATEGYQSTIDFHPNSIKINPFWGIKTEEGYSSLYLHPIHRNDLPFQMVSAIVDTDKFTPRAPYAAFVKRGFVGTIPRGTPMLQVIPFKREDWTMNIGEPSDSFIRETLQLKSTFTNAYKKIFWTRKKYK